MGDLEIVSTREEALASWDRKKVIVREVGGPVFVYPMLGRGVKYPTLDLRRDCCLNNFVSVEKAINWVRAKGWEYVVLR